MPVISSAQGLQASMDAKGTYSIQQSGWALQGRLPSGAENPLTTTGTDKLGAYQELSFRFSDPAGPMAGRIRLYDGRSVVLFQQTALKAMALAPQPFPDFTQIPQPL
ncbi:MAG TPA: hypothetical protein VK842_00490, partial [bacterium]|nr:hypothetical protein [bacterium]